MSASEIQEVRALARGLRLLEVLITDSRGWSLSEIAREAQLSKSSTYRLLQTLILNGYIVQDSTNRTGHYFPGLKLLRFSSSFLQNTSLSSVARPVLDDLAKKTGETVHLVLLDKDIAIYVEKVESPNAIRMYSQIGKRAPLHCTGVGKAIFAFLAAEQREALLTTELERFTSNTITDPDVMRSQLAEIRQRGYAVEDGEHEDQVRCIAAPLFARTGQVVGAMSIAAIGYRVDMATLHSWQPLLCERADQLNKGLGHLFDRFV